MTEETNLIRVANAGGSFLWLALSALLCVAALVALLSTLWHMRKKGWDCFWYCLLCATVLLWGLGILGQNMAILYPQWATFAAVTEALRMTGGAFVPGLLCMHLWRQVSYKEMRVLPTIVLFVAPVLYAGVYWLDALAPSLAVALPLDAHSPGLRAAFYLYYAATILAAYFLLLRVFYQVPRHMRKPARYSLVGLTIFAGVSILQQVFGSDFPYNLMLVAAVVLLCVLYYALGSSSSADVIATSRDYVLNNLSTTVLVLNSKEQILDWNTGGTGLGYLPQPQYNETFAQYRKRILQMGGRPSEHDQNIITFTKGDFEVHFLLTARELRGKKRRYGYLVEISEVTKIYTVFRYLEETATIDQLTGLHNRNAYLAWVQRAMAPENLPLLVLLGDVNNLKPLNDVYGHLAGDTLLVSVANIIRKVAPQGSFAARIGGDEYVVLVKNAGQDEAEKFLRRAEAEGAQIIQADGNATSVSWGYALVQQPQQDYNEVFAQADQMMYASKKARARFRLSGLVPEDLTAQQLDDTTQPVLPQQSGKEEPNQ